MTPHAHHGPSASEAATLRLHDLTVAYRGHPAVHHLSGQFRPGALTAIVGPNGAGKSTLLGAIAGLVQQRQGRVEGRIERPASLRMAYLPQAADLDRSFPVRVHELVATGLWAQLGSFGAVRAAERARISEALAAVGLGGFEQRLLGELSAGQAQRVLFARVLLQNATLILLDEPFNAIDARTTADLLALLQRWRSEQRTVIAVLHDLEQVRSGFDEVLLLAREKVAWGPTAEVLRAELLFRARQMAEAWDEQAAPCTPESAARSAGWSAAR
jgi:zinc/manganese transport system ATP-binding protein